MKPKNYAALSDDWHVNLETAEFLSPSKDSGPNQMVIFSDQMKNGTMLPLLDRLRGR